MFVISDIYISFALELIFIYFLIKGFKYNRKSIYIIVLNIAFIFVNILVLITAFIADSQDLTIQDKGWYLGFFTNLSYLILPWLFYWFIANYSNFISNADKLAFSKLQLLFLFLSFFSGLLPAIFPDLIGVTQTDPYSLYNWDYGWQIYAFQAGLWLLFLVLYVIAQDNANRIKEDNKKTKKFIFRFTLSAVLIFSTPVFYVVSSSFILLSLVAYILGYYLIHTGIESYYLAQ